MDEQSKQSSDIEELETEIEAQEDAALNIVEFNEEDLDNFLLEEEPEFMSELEEVKQSVDEGTASNLVDSRAPRSMMWLRKLPATKKIIFLIRKYNLIRSKLSLRFSFGELEIFKKVFVVKDYLKYLMSKLTSTIVIFFNFLKDYQNWGKDQWLLVSKFVGLLVLVGLITFLVKKKDQILDKIFIAEVDSFEPFAESIVNFNPAEDLRSSNILNAKDFLVKIRKFVINLQPTKDSPQGMAFVELFVNMSSQNYANLAIFNESQIVDLMSRTVESLTYEEISTQLGKSKLKDLVRLGINDYLGDDAVRGVYLNHIVIKK